jgi:peptidoglycan/LPS O-acetylase OafA/YrhL
LGVNLFFIISGFVILMTAWGQTVDGFAASRVARLFPAYWVSVILTAGLLFFVWPGKDVTPLQALSNLVMIHPAYGVHHVDGVYWTLWTELRFYLLIGVFLCLGITRRRIIAMCSLWPMLGALAHNADQQLIASLLVWEYAPYFAVGMMLYLIRRDGHTVLSWALVTFNGVLILKLGTDFAAGMHKYTGRTPSMTVTVLLLVAAIALVALTTCESAQRLQWKWLTIAGALTYPLYLIHQYWGFWIISEWHDKLGKRATLALAASVCLLMAWAIHRLVERPLGPRLRSWVSRGLAQAAEHDAAGVAKSS